MTKRKTSKKATKKDDPAVKGWSVEYRPIPEEWGIRCGRRILKWAKTKEAAEKVMEEMKAAAGPATARKTKAA